MRKGGEMRGEFELEEEEKGGSSEGNKEKRFLGRSRRKVFNLGATKNELWDI